MMPGIPKRRINRQLNPFLKNMIFQISPNQCRIPTNNSVTGIGRNSDNMGTMIVEVPKPVIVPIEDEIKVIKTKNGMLSILLDSY